MSAMLAGKKAGEDAAAADSLGGALLEMVRRPVSTLVAAWNWKAACISACIRASLFFATNLRAGRGTALRASLVEAGFAILAAGMLAAVTQRLRHTRPVWATAGVVWLVLPGVLLLLQSAVHTLGGTPHMRAGLIASFFLAALGSGFNWFAQRRGLLLTGAEADPARRDLLLLPRALLEFVLAGPRAIQSVLRELQLSSQQGRR